jgi:hypothetical protein
MGKGTTKKDTEKAKHTLNIKLPKQPKHVNFNYVITTPMADGKTIHDVDRKMVEQVPRFGFSQTQDNNPETKLHYTSDYFKKFRREAINSGEINRDTGNISGEHAHNPHVIANTNANSVYIQVPPHLQREIDRRNEMRKSSRTKKGKGYRKTRKTRKTRTRK